MFAAFRMAGLGALCGGPRRFHQDMNLLRCADPTHLVADEPSNGVAGGGGATPTSCSPGCKATSVIWPTAV